MILPNEDGVIGFIAKVILVWDSNEFSIDSHIGPSASTSSKTDLIN